MPDRHRPPRTRLSAAPRVVLCGVLAFGLVSPPLAAQTFDRLFTTASERLMLDQARRDYREPAPAPPPVAETPSMDTAPRGPVVPQITLSGVVIRGNGKDTTWINGAGIRPDETTPEGIRVQPEQGGDGRVQIVLPDVPTPIVLRPGQKIDLATGAVLDAYQRTPTDKNQSVFKRAEVASPAPPPAPGEGDSAPEPAAASGG